VKHPQPNGGRAARLSWPAILERAAEIAESYDPPPTLRQLFYRLVAEGVLPNRQAAYKGLSRETAKARRWGRFRRLTDNTRSIDVFQSWENVAEARTWLAEQFALPRDRGQEWALFVAAEKDTMSAFLWSWFGEYGVRVFTLRGYSSESLTEQVAHAAYKDGRPPVLIYAGDHDPSGEDIDRDFVKRAGGFDAVERVALDWDQVTAYDLPPAVGKATDSRAAAFQARHGRLVQVELEAFPPDVLRGLYEEAFGRYWDKSTYEALLAEEKAERAKLVDGEEA
jgi:hypothetical protein